MSDAFAPMAPSVLWFRVARPRFLPADRVLPNPDWLIPSSDDVREGAARGRRPGLSIWDRGRTTVAQSCAIMGEDGLPAFGMTVAEACALGDSAGLPLAAVYDPVEGDPPGAGAEGHGLLEGLHREPGGPKAAHKALRAVIAERLRPVD